MQDFKGALHIAKLDNSMFAEINSSSCLAAGSCQPLGGHSVWAAMPPFPADGSIDGLPVILVISQADGIGLFHDLIKVPIVSRVYCQIKALLQGSKGIQSIRLSRDVLRVYRISGASKEEVISLDCSLDGVQVLGSHVLLCYPYYFRI